MHIDRRRLPTGRPHLVSADVNRLDATTQKQPATQSAEAADDVKDESLREKRLLDDRLDRLSERWRFDCTGETVGADEEDRVLFDDFNPK